MFLVYKILYVDLVCLFVCYFCGEEVRDNVDFNVYLIWYMK